MQIKLYRIAAKPTEMDKSSEIKPANLIMDIADYKLVGGANVTDLNIVIRKEGGFTRAPNYAYIPELHRYYFITSYSILNNNSYSFQLHCDVLHTYRFIYMGDDVQSKNLYVKRSAAIDNITPNDINDELLTGSVKTITTDTAIATDSSITANAAGNMLVAVTAKGASIT